MKFLVFKANNGLWKIIGGLTYFISLVYACYFIWNSGSNSGTENQKILKATASENANTHRQILGISIPCLIHQSWKTRQLPSDRAHRWRKTWIKCLPDCKHVLWTDEDNRKLIHTHYQWLLPVYECLKSGVQKADVARYVYMLHYGGIYTDIDTVCLRDFRYLLKSWSLVFGGMSGHWIRSVNGTYVQNSFMASAPGHPFWLGLLHRIASRQWRKLKGGAEETTGPLILMEELQQYMNSGQKDVNIFPPELFNPFSWITNHKKECKTHGSMSEKDEAACIASFPGAYVVQMHAKSWGGGKT